MALWRKSVLGHEMDEFAVEPEDRAKLCVAQSRRPFGDHVENRLQIGRRARDDAENVVGRGLLLQRFGERLVARLHLVEQANVLDGDHRLVGEGLQERNLLVAEGPDLGAPDNQYADGFSAAHQRCGCSGPMTGSLSQGFTERKFLPGSLQVVNVHRLAVGKGTTGDPVAVDRQCRGKGPTEWGRSAP